MNGTWNLACAGLIAASMALGCGKPAPAPEAVRPVRTIKVGDLKAITGREFPGRAKARDEVDLSFQVSGPLVSLPVDVGSQVKTGDVIASIDPRDFQAALDTNQGNLERAKANLLAMERGSRPEEIEQLKAALEQAEASYKQAYAEHERNANLIKTESISRSEFDMTYARATRSGAEVKAAREALNIGMKGARPEDLEAKRAEIKALEAAVADAKNELDYSVLKSPFDGKVAARYVDNFQTVQAKQTIVRLLDVSKIEVTIQVPESLIGLVPRVKKALCRFDALPGKEFIGQVTKIGSEASQTMRTYPVTVAVDQPETAEILPGMAATVRNQPEEGDDKAASQDLIVPPSALFEPVSEKVSGPCVWVVGSDKRVALQAVETGKLTPVGMIVTKGLKPGDVVVTAGVHSLRAGQEVKLLQEGSR